VKPKTATPQPVRVHVVHRNLGVLSEELVDADTSFDLSLVLTSVSLHRGAGGRLRACLGSTAVRTRLLRYRQNEPTSARRQIGNTRRFAGDLAAARHHVNDFID
jgi:hypothetical protein